MCRLVVYRGGTVNESILLADLLVKPKHSIIHQSYKCRERFEDTGLPPQLNADGFGIGWYFEGLYGEDDSIKQVQTKSEDEFHHVKKQRVERRARTESDLREPCAFVSVTPAWNNRNLSSLSAKIRSPLFFAHVRAASIGIPASEQNCHPFTHDKYMFMHNGGIGQFSKLKRRICNALDEEIFNSLNGSTDSEYCFGLFLTQLNRIHGLKHDYTAHELLDALTVVIKQIVDWTSEASIKDHSILNFAVTDGASVICTRYVYPEEKNAASLYMSSGTKWVCSEKDRKEYLMQRSDKREHVVIIASERLSEENHDWIMVPKNHALLVTPTMNVLMKPMNIQAGPHIPN